jgi:hypothetical protein
MKFDKLRSIQIFTTICRFWLSQNSFKIKKKQQHCATKMLLPRVLILFSLIDTRAILSFGVKTESHFPLQRLRTNKDVRWTFSYLGLPNDPHSVKIDEINENVDDDIINQDSITMMDDFDWQPRDDDMSMMVPTRSPTKRDSVTVKPTTSNFPVHDSNSPITDSPVVSNSPTISPISVVPVLLPSFRPDNKDPTLISKVPSILPIDSKSHFPSISPSIIPTIKLKNLTGMPEAPVIKSPTFVQMPSTSPSLAPSVFAESSNPSEIISNLPSIYSTGNPTHVISSLPSVATAFDQTPSTAPSSFPSISTTTNLPSTILSKTPSLKLSNSPSTDASMIPSVPPTRAYLYTLLPSHLPSNSPFAQSKFPTKISQLPTLTTNPVASLKPSLLPSTYAPRVEPTFAPIITSVPTAFPSESTENPSLSPTLVCGMTQGRRHEAIVEQISNAVGTNAFVLLNMTTPQSKALTWLLEERNRTTCPGVKLIQRWVLATFYFSTGGDKWFECSATTDATDKCGTMAPFVGKKRFLSEENECFWAGIKCDTENCVTQIEFGKFMV